VLQQTYTPEIETQGTDWIALAANQTTLYYTSEGRRIKRYNLSGSGSQLPDLPIALPDPGTAYGLRLLPPFDGSGGLIVADYFNIKRLDSNGAVIQTYDRPGADGWFSVSLDPNGTSFWALVTGVSTSGSFYRFNLATGNPELGPFYPDGSPASGICVKGEPTTPPIVCASSGWCTGISPSIGLENNELRAITVIAHDNIWAVGGHSIVSGSGQSLIERWDGSNWSIIPTPNIGVLYGVSHVSPTDVWAVGAEGSLRWNGSAWSIVAVPANTTPVRAVVARSSNEVWAVGQNKVLRWNGIAWSVDHTETNSTLTGITYGASPGSITPQIIKWAVGYTGSSPNRTPIILRKINEGSWTAEPLPTFTDDAYLTSIDLYSAAYVWAVGSYFDTTASQYNTLTLHRDRRDDRWEIVASPNAGSGSNALNDVWVTTEGDVWAVGSWTDSGLNLEHVPLPDANTYILRYNDTAWHEVASPNPGEANELLGVATIPGNFVAVTSVWAVGSFLVTDGGSSRTLVEHIEASPAPPPSTSYYENELNLAKHYQQGCTAAKNGERGLIVLDYGQPIHIPSGTPGYGALLIGPSDEAAYISHPLQPDITEAVQEFADGYHDAFYNPTSNCQASGPVQNITLVISINNYTLEGDVELTVEHADEWSEMVSDVGDYLVDNDYDEISAVAGIDAEPNWDTAYTRTEDWVEAYNDSGVSIVYNFGSTDGYPRAATGDPVPAVPSPWICCSAWTTQQFYHISYELPLARSLPQIYGPQFARNWYRVKRWSIENQSAPLNFSGEMSECKSSPCTQTSSSIFFNEEQAWQVFWLELNYDPQTQQPLNFSTDIRCSNGNYNVGCSP
jgi:hypothetical protein